jgi:succinyl-diaminopimelate desuccinylase
MPIAAYIDRHANELIAFLREIVAVATVNPPGDHYDAVTRQLGTKLEEAGLDVRRYSIPKALLKRSLPPEQQGYPRYNVLGKWRVRGAKKTLHFNAHYDVVPVSGSWRHGGPFSGAVSKGWIYGRGTADMKGSIASLVLALKALQATGAQPALNIEVSFTADEETDSLLGTGWLVRHAPIRPDYAVVMEGGEDEALCCGHNGVVWLEVAVHGRAAHGSLPEHGINALEKMSSLVLALDEYKKKLTRTQFVTPEGKTMRPTINLGGVFSGGEGGKVNTVPAFASFTIDRRVLAVEDHAAAERDLRTFLAAAARKIPDCRISVRKISENFACFRRPDGPFFSAAAASVRRIRRSPTVFCGSTGFNDMRFFAHELGIPTVGYGPGGKDFHAVDERASVKNLLSSAKIYADLMTTFAG